MKRSVNRLYLIRSHLLTMPVCFCTTSISKPTGRASEGKNRCQNKRTFIQDRSMHLFTQHRGHLIAVESLSWKMGTAARSTAPQPARTNWGSYLFHQNVKNWWLGSIPCLPLWLVCSFFKHKGAVNFAVKQQLL